MKRENKVSCFFLGLSVLFCFWERKNWGTLDKLEIFERLDKYEEELKFGYEWKNQLRHKKHNGNWRYIKEVKGEENGIPGYFITWLYFDPETGKLSEPAFRTHPSTNREKYVNIQNATPWGDFSDIWIL